MMLTTLSVAGQTAAEDLFCSRDEMVALGLGLVLVSHMFSSDSQTPSMQTNKMFNLFN